MHVLSHNRMHGCNGHNPTLAQNRTRHLTIDTSYMHACARPLCCCSQFLHRANRPHCVKKQTSLAHNGCKSGERLRAQDTNTSHFHADNLCKAVMMGDIVYNSIYQSANPVQAKGEGCTLGLHTHNYVITYTITYTLRVLLSPLQPLRDYACRQCILRQG
jgi:hypothetical protein